MSKLISLQVFFTERLTAAAVEIFAVVEKTVVEYQNEIRRSKEENERLQRTLDLVFKPDVKIHRTDLQQFSLPVYEEEHPPEQQQHREQEWSSSLGQKNPETPQIKQEEREFKTSQQEEQLQALQFDIKETIFTPPSVNGDCNQEDPPQPSRLDQTGESRDSPAYPDYSPEQSGNNFERDEEDKSKGQQLGVKLLKSKRPYKKTIHIREKPFLCEQCGKSFSQNSVLTRHMKTQHTGEKPYMCLTCNKRFKKMGILKIHQRTHTGEKPHECKHCGKCFGLTGALNRHMMIHTGEKPFQCKYCGKRFNQSGDLTRHVMTHTVRLHGPVEEMSCLRETAHPNSPDTREELPPNPDGTRPLTRNGFLGWLTVVNIHPDITIPELTPETDLVIHRMSGGRPDRYGYLLFRKSITEETYGQWVADTNWDGSRGKRGLPVNLRQYIISTTAQKFPAMTNGDRKCVKDRINESLRTPRAKPPGL